MVAASGDEPELASSGTRTEPSQPSGKLARLRGSLEGRYIVREEVGRGGMATVYLADDLKHRRKVAIKVLRPEASGRRRSAARAGTTYAGMGLPPERPAPGRSG
jgi:serine/threonine protein kinase